MRALETIAKWVFKSSTVRITLPLHHSVDVVKITNVEVNHATRQIILTGEHSETPIKKMPYEYRTTWPETHALPWLTHEL